MEKGKEETISDQDLKILFIGKSGSGKTTFLNLVANLIVGAKYQDERKVAVPHVQKIELEIDGEIHSDKDQGQKIECNIEEFKGLSSENNLEKNLDSKTSAPNLYIVKDKKTGRKIIFIDTPGLDDTRGGTHDEEHIEAIIHTIFFLGGVHAICLVHNSTTPRLDPSTELALTRLKDMFTSSCLSNILVCLTNSTPSITPKCEDALKELGFDTKKTYRFQNNCLVHPDAYNQLCVKLLGEINEEAVERATAINQVFWNQGKTSFKNLIKAAKSLPLIDVESMKQKYLQNQTAATLVQLISLTIQDLSDKKLRLQSESNKIKELLEEMENNKDFSKTKVLKRIKKKVIEDRTVKQKISTKDTKCLMFWSLGGISVAISSSLVGVAALICLAAFVLSEPDAEGDSNYYYKYVKEPIEVEVDDWEIEVLDQTDTGKQEAFESSQHNLQLAREKAEQIKLDIEQGEIAKQESFEIVAYLIKKINDEKAANLIDQQKLIDAIVKELDLAETKLRKVHNQKKELGCKNDQSDEAIKEKNEVDCTFKQLSDHRDRLVIKKKSYEQIGVIIEQAKTLTPKEDLGKLSKKLQDMMVEEKQNESKKLAFYKALYASAKPWLVDIDKDLLKLLAA